MNNEQAGGRVYTLEDAKVELQTLEQERDILNKMLHKLKRKKTATSLLLTNTGQTMSLINYRS